MPYDISDWFYWIHKPHKWRIWTTETKINNWFYGTTNLEVKRKLWTKIGVLFMFWNLYFKSTLCKKDLWLTIMLDSVLIFSLVPASTHSLLFMYLTGLKVRWRLYTSHAEKNFQRRKKHIFGYFQSHYLYFISQPIVFRSKSDSMGVWFFFLYCSEKDGIWSKNIPFNINHQSHTLVYPVDLVHYVLVLQDFSLLLLELVNAVQLLLFPKNIYLMKNELYELQIH